jgi:hypothetical protein
LRWFSLSSDTLSRSSTTSALFISTSSFAWAWTRQYLRELNTYFDPYSIGVSYLFQLLLVSGAQLVHLLCVLLLQLLDFAEVRLR